MIISCTNCGKKYTVQKDSIDHNGRIVRCYACEHEWLVRPDDLEEGEVNTAEEVKKDETSAVISAKSDADATNCAKYTQEAVKAERLDTEKKDIVIDLSTLSTQQDGLSVAHNSHRHNISGYIRDHGNDKDYNTLLWVLNIFLVLIVVIMLIFDFRGKLIAISPPISKLFGYFDANLASNVKFTGINASIIDESGNTTLKLGSTIANEGSIVSGVYAIKFIAYDVHMKPIFETILKYSVQIEARSFVTSYHEIHNIPKGIKYFSVQLRDRFGPCCPGSSIEYKMIT